MCFTDLYFLFLCVSFRCPTCRCRNSFSHTESNVIFWYSLIYRSFLRFVCFLEQQTYNKNKKTGSFLNDSASLHVLSIIYG